jgi:chondroitin AC lyase
MSRSVIKKAMVFLACFFSAGYAFENDFDIVKKRVTADALPKGIDDAVVEQLLVTFRPDSTWPGIDYQDVSREAFEHRIHYTNLVLLAQAYRHPASIYFKNKKVKQTLMAALAFWVRNDFICDNWWYNQIGTPDNLTTVMLLIGGELPQDLVAKAQPIIGRAHLNASGARPSGDRIKIAGIMAKNLLFIGDRNGFNTVIRVIESEIKFSTGRRGMQHDYSFHHREDRVNNTLSYGQGYAETFAEWAAWVAGTEYAFATEKINQLIDYYLDGMCKQMVYGKTDDPGTQNRDISRENSLQVQGTSAIEQLLAASGYRRAELEEIMNIRKGETAPGAAFAKFFWQSEHYVHQRPDYFASVRMHSVRNRNMEVPYNSEGLKNHHRGDGTNYISRRGDEYKNIAPVYDWQKIPGATVLQKPALPPASDIQKDGLSEFVGAVTDGRYGAVAFDFTSPHDPLKAKKAWFFFDEEYVCLGTGIRSQADRPVVTTLNQCLLRGQVVVMNGTSSILTAGEHLLNNVSWVYHDSIGYLFPEPVAVHLSNTTATGTWFDINGQSHSSKQPITREVFKLWLDHGPEPDSAAYQYIVRPAIALNDLETVAAAKEIRITANTPEIQAVRHAGLQLCAVLFYRYGDLEICPGLRISLDSPGAVLIKTDGGLAKEISVADPSRKLASMHLRLSQEVKTSSEHFTAVWDKSTRCSRITIDLPKNEYAGKSVTITL